MSTQLPSENAALSGRMTDDYYGEIEVDESMWAGAVFPTLDKKLKIVDIYEIPQESANRYVFRLYITDFGDVDVSVEGAAGYGLAATLRLTGFRDAETAFDTAAAFILSDSFPCGYDADLDRVWDNTFWRVWTPDDSETWHIFQH